MRQLGIHMLSLRTGCVRVVLSWYMNIVPDVYIMKVGCEVVQTKDVFLGYMTPSDTKDWEGLGKTAEFGISEQM